MGGEEHLLAIELASAGWGLAYVDEIVAHHHPSPSDDRNGRRMMELRNAFWSTWLRRPLPTAMHHSARLLAQARGGDPAWRASLAALRGLPWVLRERTPVSREIEARLRAINGPGTDGFAG
jgi:hypothetical protein